MKPTAPLPLRDGVAPSYLWLQEAAGLWSNMLDFLTARFPGVTEEAWRQRMARGEVVNQDGVMLTPASPYRRGDCIFYYRDLEGSETPIPFTEQILHQDAHLLVVDKPHFVPVIPTGRFLHESLLVRLKKKTGLADLTPIHRLDRETAGVIIFSHNPASRGAYQAMFQQRTMDKTYEALAGMLEGRSFPFVHRSRMVDADKFFLMREEEGEPNSETQVDLIERRGALGLYRLNPVTGRKHQLRVHMAALGIPIVNDNFYPHVVPAGMADNYDAPLKLLARSIAFTDPLSGDVRYFESLRTL
ncbi:MULTISPECIES: pseudouridine synthase [unclassified Herbaspirillum]|uniref:pseudouridine synthase n=1 Tax=unclassified Herbaspirillum TaxID=2624150 RepID=UPI000E2F3180|nr:MULTISPECIES: pseudouridine synthase [unclassified Herbaspirillum]RFB73343.1 pseudouridine synthase [Herbaspirillum sp. 3R-3a1]TFI10852.1 pseudouridine synthase [Herbaspirillum sp. 3R11]TFI16760.1 pseudouridine synthase [Herbaspirillum sp. 3R-11]TFI29310.1 pseudouridine synthase [Herbaspirillum sp. 3C11]